jgi:acetoacetyl-CoA synthetase
MENTPVWSPSSERARSARLTRFAAPLGFDPPDYHALWQWSVANPERFWQAVWKDLDVIAAEPPTAVLEDANRMPGARWFPGARFNFAEHLLRPRGDGPALIAVNEAGRRVVISRDELRQRVGRFAAGLAADGVVAGDRVAGFVPNSEHAIIAMLATASLGALWTSCSPDFGESGVLDRFGQTEPKVLVACDGYFYGGKTLDSRERVARIRDALPSLKRLVLIPMTGQPMADTVNFDDYGDDRAPAFAPMPFDHPLYVMYSSGTTGKPKCIVHGAGGTLLQHWKEHALQSDIGDGDVLFFFTTCGWMMWNWLVSGLMTGATLVLYDGSPFHPGPDGLWAMAEREGVTHFGTSPKYLSALEKAGHRPQRHHALSRLRTLFSTGSPLAPEQYDFVHQAIKADVQLASISGGTDILSCFALGNPWSPVHRGALQGPGLGMAVDVWSADGQPVRDAPGELVCTQPFPSMPVGFWNDEDGSRYRAAYFEAFPGVWHHGDYCQWTSQGGLIITGRSDATLNPGGVRIGTAEIYRVVEAQPEVQDAVVVGHRRDGDENVILFVCLRPGHSLDDALVARIRGAIRAELTPRHVPHRVLACPEVPRTISGKVTEIAVRDLIHGRAVKNADALANPAALDFFARLTSEDLD